MTAPRHLVSVWNPSYAINAMEEHLAILLAMAKAYDTDQVTVDQLYVWWGKVRSSNRQQRLAHESEIEELSRELAGGAEREMHLYLTDYRSLYVAHIGAISMVDVSATDRAHVPPYYPNLGLACDCWFKLLDIRRLAHDDTLAVIHELAQLRNLHYQDRPVSLYGGMVDMPLIVKRTDDVRFFDEESRDGLIGDRLWAEFDAETGGAGAMERELRENLFGEAAWSAFDSATRIFIATAEKIFRDHRTDDSFDFHAVMGDYAKAIEVETNRLLRRALAKAPVDVALVNIDGQSRDLRRYRLTLGQLSRAIAGDKRRAQHLVTAIRNGKWFVDQYPSILDDFVKEVRNPGTHEKRVDRKTATRWRDRLAGVGCEGVLVELVRG